jgi:putative polyketide hydroxylase
MTGSSALGHQVNITFRADLRRALRGRPVNLAMILNPAERGLLLNIDGECTWTTQAIYAPEAGQAPDDYTDQRCVQVIRTHVGDPELEVQILRRAAWVSAARVAERFREGRVFLAGDAAHEMPPAGGFGMNTGFGDAHNLAWKLGAVLHGWGGADLLDSYDAERRPVAVWITEQTLRNLASVGRVAGQETARLGRPEFFRELGLVFGTRYESTAVMPTSGDPPAPENPVTDYIPSGFPGCRAPHVWLDLDQNRVSTLDLLGPWFTALVSGNDDVADVGGVPLRTVHTGSAALYAAYGLGPGECALVRPDGHVAWRGPTQRAGAGLSRVVCNSMF